MKMPHAIDVERSVLAAILTDKHACIYAHEVLLDDCFYNSANKAIFTASREVIKAGYQSDLITVCEFLRRDGKMAEIGGESTVSEIIENAGTTANVINHVKILLEKAIMRGMMECFTRGIAYVSSVEAVPDVALDTAEHRLLEYRKRLERVGGEERYTHADSVSAYIAGLADRPASGVIGLQWPVGKLNEITMGALKGKTYLFAGYEKGGKSRFIRHCISNWSREGHPGVVVLCEEDQDAIHKCILANRCRINTRNIESKNLSELELAQLREAEAEYSSEPIYICKKPAASPVFVQEILEREHTKWLRQGKRIEWCIIDTVQRMRKQADDQNTMHEEIAAELSDIALKMNIPIIEVMQFVSGTERGDKTKGGLHAHIRYGKAYREAAHAIIVWDDRRKSKKELESEQRLGYRVVRANVVQREGRSFGYIEAKAELQYSYYSDASSDEVSANAVNQDSDTGF